MPTLLYIVIAFQGSGWHGAMPIHTTADQAQCVAMAAQLATTGRSYECHTLVLPGART